MAAALVVQTQACPPKIRVRRSSKHDRCKGLPPLRCDDPTRGGDGRRARRGAGLVTAGAAATTERPKENAGGRRDNWLDRLAIRYLTACLQSATGFRAEKEGYDGLVEAAGMVARHFDKRSQQELVLRSLDRAFPAQITALVRSLMPSSKLTRECFALFTVIFFPWLVGSCVVKESVLHGSLEKNVVHIKKCRFLEGTNCVALCINMCKIPSQEFINNSLGIPVYMVPNFEDMSCDMVFGQQPPSAADDPTLAQPCHHFSCKAKQTQGVDCSSM